VSIGVAIVAESFPAYVVGAAHEETGRGSREEVTEA
jgi:hypothetical protein